MNELEKSMAGEWYDCHNEIFLQYKNNARKLLSQYNSFSYEQKERKGRSFEVALRKYWNECINRDSIYLRLWKKYSYWYKCIN